MLYCFYIVVEGINMGRMLTFYPKLYLGEGIKGTKLDKIIRRLEAKPLLANVYVITFAQNPSDQLEFFDARQLAQGYYDNLPLQVIGIAKDYTDALEVVERIVQECVNSRGDCKLKEYLVC